MNLHTNKLISESNVAFNDSTVLTRDSRNSVILANRKSPDSGKTMPLFFLCDNRINYLVSISFKPITIQMIKQYAMSAIFWTT